MSSAYPCTCGSATCTTNQLCNQDGNTCGVAAGCSEVTGTALSTVYPCTCGTSTCTSGQLCVLFDNTCKTQTATCGTYACPTGWTADAGAVAKTCALAVCGPV